MYLLLFARFTKKIVNYVPYSIIFKFTIAFLGIVMVINSHRPITIEITFVTQRDFIISIFFFFIIGTIVNLLFTI